MHLKPFSCILATGLFLFAAILNLSFAQTPFTGEVNSENINIRSDSTIASEIICQIKKGTRVEVISDLYDWYKIRLPKQAPSYAKKELFECIDAVIEPNKRCLAAKAVKGRINIRLKPNESSPILGRLDKDEVVNIVKSTGDWYRIEPIQNSFGWINKKFVNKTTTETKISVSQPGRLAEEARENIVVEGIIKPYGRVFNRIATHKLITKENEIFLLKGNKQSLDALNYHKVKIIGKKNDLAKRKYPVIEVTVTEVIN